MPEDPSVSVRAAPAFNVTAFAEPMFTPNTEMPAVSIGFSTAVNVFKKSAVSAEVGTTPPTHDPAALKSTDPCTQPIEAPLPTAGAHPSSPAISTATTRPANPRLNRKTKATGEKRRNLVPSLFRPLKPKLSDELTTVH
jgi:hypothetical protein